VAHIDRSGVNTSNTFYKEQFILVGWGIMGLLWLFLLAYAQRTHKGHQKNATSVR